MNIITVVVICPMAHIISSPKHRHNAIVYPSSLTSRQEQNNENIIDMCLSCHEFYYGRCPREPSAAECDDIFTELFALAPSITKVPLFMECNPNGMICL